MTEIRKIKHVSFALFVAGCLALLWFIGNSAKNLFSVTTEWNFASIALTCVGALIMIATLMLALIMLHSIKSDETPFNSKNVRRLKMIALLLVIYEPYFYLNSYILRKIYPIVIGDVTVEAHSSLGGIVLTVGLVVYCVSLVFGYGIALQRQVDETL